MFRTVPLSIVRSSSLYTQQLRPACKLLANLYDMYNCCVCSEKLLIMDTGSVRNMYNFNPKQNLRYYCIWLVSLFLLLLLLCIFN